MNLKKEEKTIAECDLKVGTGIVTSDNLFTVRINKGQKVTLDTIEIGVRFMESLGGGPYLNLFVFDDFADVASEVRKWAANPGGNLYTLADAIVISGLPQKIIADFYLKFNKPVKPTKIFRDENKAKEWLLSLNLKK